MAEAPMLYTPPPSPPKLSNLPSLYCALIIVGTAVFLLGFYNFIITRWCNENDQTNQSLEQDSNQVLPNNLNMNIVSSFRYKKEQLGEMKNNEYCECSVCLSDVEEGEEVKQLPICKHSFHASCIDMWLYSHLDCPLCRSPVEGSVLHRSSSLTRQEESSRDGLIVVQGSSV